MFGNKSLFNSSYLAFKTVKKKEMEGTAEMIKKMVKKTQKGQNYEEMLLETANSYCNPVKAYLDMKISFLLWKRYY